LSTPRKHDEREVGCPQGLRVRTYSYVAGFAFNPLLCSVNPREVCLVPPLRITDDPHLPLHGTEPEAAADPVGHLRRPHFGGRVVMQWPFTGDPGSRRQA